MLRFLEEQNGSLVFRYNGETFIGTPWGNDSLRVRGTFPGEIKEGSIALLESYQGNTAQIGTGE